VHLNQFLKVEEKVVKEILKEVVKLVKGKICIKDKL
jgi:hypothetical protein